MGFVLAIALHLCILIDADIACSGKETCSSSHSWGCSFPCDFIFVKAICSSRDILLGFFFCRCVTLLCAGLEISKTEGVFSQS